MLGLERMGRGVRLQHALLLAMLAGWLLYTRFLASLQVLHLTLPPCPFLVITGHPCPFCGGTRSFAAMWNGDLTRAARLYPLGPLLFPLTLLAAGYLGAAALAGWRLGLRLPRRLEFAAIGAGLALLASSWSLKLLWLGN